MCNPTPIRYYVCEINSQRYLTNNGQISSDISHARLFHSTQFAMIKGLEKLAELVKHNTLWQIAISVQIQIQPVMATITAEKLDV